LIPLATPANLADISMFYFFKFKLKSAGQFDGMYRGNQLDLKDVPIGIDGTIFDFIEGTPELLHGDE
jgi:hypothetical protein